MAESQSKSRLKITKAKNLRKLASKVYQNREKTPSDLRPIHALDTETWQGNIILLADSDGDFIDTYKKGITIDTVIEFLTRSKYETSWNFFWNLSYDSMVILKLLGKSVLSTYKRKRAFRFKYNEYSFFYIPKKTLRISKGKHSWVFYDIIQFYDFKALPVAYQENIATLPENYLKTKSTRKQFSPNYYRKNLSEIRSYCITDCKLTMQLCVHWVKLFFEAFGFYPARWISSGYLAEKVILNFDINIPFFKDFPYDLQEFAFCSYFGGRFELIQRGFIGKAWLYDINSAYPYALANLPDITKGKWRHGLKKINSKALLGFFKIEATIPDSEYLPLFPFRRVTNNNDVIIFPSGNFVTYVTLEELKLADPRHYKILDSWQYFDENPSYPFREFIHKFYDERMRLKAEGNPLQLPIKIILNAIYGKMGQKVNRRIGNLFNPIIFAYITGYTRAQLYRFVKENNLEKDVVAFATDSVCVTRPIDVNSSELGGFGFEKTADDVYYLQNGFYRFGDKWKSRGLGKLGKKEIENVATYEKDGKLYMKYVMNRTKQLAMCIIQNKIEDIGNIREHEREINLNADNKRFWVERLNNIDEKKKNRSFPLNPQQFPEAFELNDNY
jgi:hypothetical protein